MANTCMAWQRHSSDLAAFPTPWPSTDVYYPNMWPNMPLPIPYGMDWQLDKDPDDWKNLKSLKTLRDKSLADHAGDLGWSLDYATAWCYRHLLDNRLDIEDAVDNVREIEVVEGHTPFLIFDYLDRALFRNKLRSMVFLTWTSQASCSSGTTSAPGVIGTRITIQLNSTPFLDGDDGIDDLLDALIHHMIHAFFLVCCGAQKKGDKQDGRLLDGLHFGVILLTIKDITEECEGGPLPLIFHASKRVNDSDVPLMKQLVRLQMPHDPYISMDPRGRAIVPPTLDGQTHCLHDNRNINQHHIKNWQVQDFARAIDLDMESKGDEIWDFDKKGNLGKSNRLKIGASATYAELLWDEKYIVVSREKALEFKSLEKSLKKGDYRLKIPKCKEEILKCIHDYISNGEYDGSSLEDDRGLGRRLGGLQGPPIIVFQNFPRFQLLGEPKCDALTHIQVFKIARDMEFEELMNHSMARLSVLPVTNDDPMEILRQVYDVKGNEIGPASIHPALHKFVREFLSVTDDVALFPAEAHERLLIQRHLGPRGLSNYQKISRGRGPEFEDLFLRSPVFRDDVKLITDGRDHSIHRRHGPAGLLAQGLAGNSLGALQGIGNHQLPLGLGWNQNNSPLGLGGIVRDMGGLMQQRVLGRDLGGGLYAEDRLGRGQMYERYQPSYM